MSRTRPRNTGGPLRRHRGKAQFVKRETIFVQGNSSSLHDRMLSALEQSGVNISKHLPSSRRAPLLILAPPTGLEPWEQYSHYSYCLALGQEPVARRRRPQPNVTWLASSLGQEELLESVLEWLLWAQLDRESSLAELRLLGRSSAFCRMIAGLYSAARFDAPALLKGETGTGKEVAARAIHEWSPRSKHSFVAVNCGGQNDDLFASELFGHEKGAFTDAKERRLGLVAVANGGTLFLDEVNSLSSKSQASLLRFMQDQTYRPLGGQRTLTANVRVVAASNQPLDELVRSGQMREDLYYRLEVLSVRLPPLRERQQDIPLLAQFFLDKLNSRYDLPPKHFSCHALAKLCQQAWPGNVRELENQLHRLFALTSGEEIDLRRGRATPTSMAQDSGPSVAKASLNPEDIQPFQLAKNEAIELFERQYLKAVLAACGGNISQAARSAGKERRTFGRLVQKYGLNQATQSVAQNNR